MDPRRAPYRLLLEFAVVFIAVPPLLAMLKPRGWIYILLWVAVMQCCRVMEKNHGWNLREDWNFGALNRATIIPILKRFVPLALLLLGFAWATIPERMFSLPLQRPAVWVIVVLLYPPLSAVPQELV